MYKQKIILACLLLFTIAPAVPAQQADSPEPQPATPAVETQCIASLQIRTNLLYWAAATPNLGMEWKPSNSFGVLVNGAWSHWIWSGEGRHHRTWMVSPEIRYYFGGRGVARNALTHNAPTGWFIGIEGHAAEFNFKFKDTGYQGDALGGGLTGGYRLSLGRDAINRVSTFYLEFSLGLGYTQLKYDTYHRSNDIMVRKESNLKKNVFAPTQLGVSLIFKL
ncbi:hypothetical protein AGMMS50239_29190 [Bacteroidia bacterium]|nr:hypothetical protein AGMMS50239_29190 [Bacteroidia bacterium]